MPTAVFQRDVRVAADADTAWATLTDVDLLVSWVSILDQASVVDPLKRYTAVLTDRLGPFRLHADLDVEVTDVEEPVRIVVRAEGEDRQVASRITVSAELKLLPSADATVIAVAGSYEVAGRVATLGASTIRKKADKILEEFFESLQRSLS